jgi:carboxyl-terminal processing protease
MTDQNSENQQHQPLSRKESIGVWFPIILAVALGVGIVIGLEMRTQAPQSYMVLSDDGVKHEHPRGVGKVEEILRFVDARYLEGVKMEELEDAAIRGLLKELDPHSSYIPSDKLQDVKESLQGNFDGIGVEFFMLDDTITVVGVVKGGPSDEAGMEVGDKFLTVNDSAVAGQDMDDEEVVSRLKGEAGSTVKIKVLRRGKTKPIALKIERGQIPMKSVETAYMLDDQTGYIKITRFSGTTYKEFMEKLEGLVDKGMEDLVIDLRHNPGGYLNEATKILTQLFKDKRLLVYTEGRSYKRKEYKSNGRSFFKVGKLALLIDEGSASASEIMAGAIQDNDRGLIVGRRSFGKGLVQEQYELSDASALRLTVARYYTPSGRLIQRSYDNGVEDYEEDMERRYNSGELYYKDSIKIVDSTEYRTTGGRLVYGSGGIMPDVFVPIDTITRNPYYLAINNYIVPFVYRYMDKQYAQFDRYNNELQTYLNDYKVPDAVLEDYHDYALSRSSQLERNPAAWQASKVRISMFIKAYIAQQLFGDDGFNRVLHQKDDDLRTALKELKRGGVE